MGDFYYNKKGLYSNLYPKDIHCFRTHVQSLVLYVHYNLYRGSKDSLSLIIFVIGIEFITDILKDR